MCGVLTANTLRILNTNTVKTTVTSTKSQNVNHFLHVMKEYRNGGIAPLILNLDI